MAESTTSTSTPRASVAALGSHLQRLDMFRPVREQVHVPQKTVRHTPSDTLYDALIAILAGAHGLVAVNPRLRRAPALQAAFGRTACADQSTIQDTLDACDATTVQQMTQALTTIYRQYRRGYPHADTQRYQLLDVDMTGLPGGPKAALATQGSCAKQRKRRGRQRGRVLAPHYQAVVVDHLCAGTTHLPSALRPLVRAAEQTVALTAARRKRTIIRVAGGGGSWDDLTWLLRRGDQVIAKEYGGRRARQRAASVTTWVADPQVAGREVGWVDLAAPEYVRPVVRVAVRCRRQHGQWADGVGSATLDATTILPLSGQAPERAREPTAVLLADRYADDQRGGGIATANTEDQQGLGIGRRNKPRFTAQQMVMLVGTLAHNRLVWARAWLRATSPPLATLGLKRLVRDVWHVPGRLERDLAGQVRRMVLQQAHGYARRLHETLQALLDPAQVVVCLGET